MQPFDFQCKLRAAEYFNVSWQELDLFINDWVAIKTYYLSCFNYYKDCNAETDEIIKLSNYGKSLIDEIKER